MNKVKHARARFKERYGEALSDRQYWKLVDQLRAGLMKGIMWRKDGLRCYELEHREGYVYPLWNPKLQVIETFIAA